MTAETPRGLARVRLLLMLFLGCTGDFGTLRAAAWAVTPQRLRGVGLFQGGDPPPQTSSLRTKWTRLVSLRHAVGYGVERDATGASGDRGGSG